MVIDNLVNSSKESLVRVQQIAKRNLKFYEGDLENRKLTESIFEAEAIEAVIHFAGLKAVGESVMNALLYYQNNLESTIVLLEAMRKFSVKNLVFSSSATIYGKPEKVPVTEKANRYATNPYGQTKLIIEQMLEDITRTNEDWSITSLRYFNPIGAHESGRIGEDPSGLPNNLLPFVCQVAAKRIEDLKVFGDDYETIDGTGVRDYIHVIDLANAHLAAIKNIVHPNIYKAYNIGTGTGTSVLQLVKAFETVNGIKIPYRIMPRRPGDIASCYANVDLARKELDWKAVYTIEDCCKSAWNWQKSNPSGYK